MAWNGTGSYVLNPLYSPEANGQTIDAVRYNGLTTDIAAGITATLAKNGENVPTANLPMGGFKHTGAAAASTSGEYVIWGQNATLGNLTTGTITPTSVSGASAAEIGRLVGVTSAIQTQLNTKAPTASPTFTGTPAAPTAAVNTNTTQVATTAFVIGQGYAPLASPTFTGTVTAAVLTTTGNTTLGNATTDTLNVGANGLVKDASGNVGIGTASPTGKLDVVGSLGTVRVETNGSDFSFSRADANYITAKTAGGFLVFQTSGANERMRIAANGNVSITGGVVDVSGTQTYPSVFGSGATTFRLGPQIPTKGGGLVMIAGANLGGQSFVALYLVSMQVPGGQVGWFTSTLVSSTGSPPPLTLAIDGSNYLTCTVGNGGNVTNSHCFGAWS